MDAAVELKNVTKTFGPVTAVKNMDFVIPCGGLYGFIGPNGAGKTSTIRLIMSILFPDSGEISVLNYRSALEAKNRIGFRCPLGKIGDGNPNGSAKSSGGVQYVSADDFRFFAVFERNGGRRTTAEHDG